MKTLHPKVHGGLLAVRDDRSMPSDGEHHIRRSISGGESLSVQETVAQGAGFDDCIENIDIGGPAMIRAAAKNHADVAVVVEPAEYAACSRK